MTWKDKLDLTLYRALCAALHLDPDSDAGRRGVVPAATFGSALNMTIDRHEDKCIYALTLIPALGPGELRWAEDSAMLRRSVIVKALMIFYGPHAMEHAERVARAFFPDTGPDCPRAILRRQRVVPLPKPSIPRCVTEPDGSLWRERADLEMTLVALMEETKPTQTAEHPPQLTPVVQTADMPQGG